MKIANQIYKYSYIKSIFQGIRYYKYLQMSKICQSSSPRHISLEHPLSLHHSIHITNNQNIHIYLYTYIQRNQKNQRLIGSSEWIYQKSEQFLSYLCKYNLITYIPANNKLSLEKLTYKKLQFGEKVSNLQQNPDFCKYCFTKKSISIEANIEFQHKTQMANHYQYSVLL